MPRFIQGIVKAKAEAREEVMEMSEKEKVTIRLEVFFFPQCECFDPLMCLS